MVKDMGMAFKLLEDQQGIKVMKESESMIKEKDKVRFYELMVTVLQGIS